MDHCLESAVGDAGAFLSAAFPVNQVVCHHFTHPRVSGYNGPFLKPTGQMRKPPRFHPFLVSGTSQMTVVSQRNPSQSLFSYTFYSLIGTILK